MITSASPPSNAASARRTAFRNERRALGHCDPLRLWLVTGVRDRDEEVARGPGLARQVEDVLHLAELGREALEQERADAAHRTTLPAQVLALGERADLVLAVEHAHLTGRARAHVLAQDVDAAAIGRDRAPFVGPGNGLAPGSGAGGQGERKQTGCEAHGVSRESRPRCQCASSSGGKDGVPKSRDLAAPITSCSSRAGTLSVASSWMRACKRATTAGWLPETSFFSQGSRGSNSSARADRAAFQTSFQAP